MEKYRDIKWNKEMEIVREKNKEREKERHKPVKKTAPLEKIYYQPYKPQGEFTPLKLVIYITVSILVIITAYTLLDILKGEYLYSRTKEEFRKADAALHKDWNQPGLIKELPKTRQEHAKKRKFANKNRFSTKTSEKVISNICLNGISRKTIETTTKRCNTLTGKCSTSKNTRDQHDRC